jgi:hypothetical protein
MADTDTGNPTEIVRAQGAAAKLLERTLELVTHPKYAAVPDEAFIEVFPPETLARSLADHPEERAAVLDAIMKTDGAKAFRETWKSLKPDTVADVLESMLRAQATTAEIIRISLSPAAWTEVLDAKSLWRLCEHGRWWERAWIPDGEADPKVVKDTPQAMCLIALVKLIDELKLITPAEKLDRISIVRLAQDLVEALNKERLVGLLTTFLISNHVEKTALTAEELLDIISQDGLVECVEPGYLYHSVVDLAAQRLKLVPAAEEEPEAEENVLDDPNVSAEIDAAFTRLDESDIRIEGEDE